MLMRQTALILFSGFFIAAGALAQELSPGNQKIAEAIYAAQTNTETGYSVEHIADLRSIRG